MKIKLCVEPNCRNMVVDAHSSFCPLHKAIRDKRRIYSQRTSSASYNSLYHTPRWRKERKSFLQANPLCIRCGEKADTVDHIIPHKGNELIFWDKSNWQPLCHSCHSKKTLQENNNFNKKR